MGERRGR
jgi:hypothetical protein